MSEHEPNIFDELAQSVDRLNATNEAMQDSEYYGVAVAERLQDVAEAARTVALTVAVRAVQRGIMSRRQAADELHMHSNTLQRYLDDPDYSE